MVAVLVSTGCHTAPETAARTETASQPAPRAAAAQPRADLDVRIAALERRVAADPNLYPAQADLASACLEKAKVTLDPDAVKCARRSARASLDVQQSYEGFAALAGVEAFSHHFEGCLDAAVHAHGAYPEGGAMFALQVECLVGAGRIEQARRLVADTAAPVRSDGRPSAFDFYRTVARAALARADDDASKAVRAYEEAAVFAEAQKERGLQSWALVQAAGLLLDHDRAQEARPFLVRARATGPANVDLQAHEAELLAASGDKNAALAEFERLALLSPLPEPRVRAWRLAASLDQGPKAQRYYDEAEATMRRPIDAGEVYTLDMLAHLYLEAGVHVDQALALAQRNLEFKKDEAAKRLLRTSSERCRTSRGA